MSQNCHSLSRGRVCHEVGKEFQRLGKAYEGGSQHNGRTIMSQSGCKDVTIEQR